MSEDGPMNEYLKDNNIEMAAQRATSVLSVVNHAPRKMIKLKDKIKVSKALVWHSNLRAHIISPRSFLSKARVAI